MNSKMQIKIWGSRGSLPAPVEPDTLEISIRALLREFVSRGFSKESEIDAFLRSMPRHAVAGYGGNTTCVEIKSANQQIMIDGGSGLRQLGYELMSGPCGRGEGVVHLFLTHFHWDHLIGLPFFTPLFIPGNILHVYSVQPGLEGVFETLFRKPYFPVALENIGAKIVYHTLLPRRPFELGDIRLTPYRLDHPDPCWGFKVECGGRAYAHCVDTEGTRVSREELGEDLALYQGIDLMAFDAQYTVMEKLEKVDWGHATAALGLAIAMREGVKRVLFMHHDPASSHLKVAEAEAQARRYYEEQLKTGRQQGLSLHEVEWSFAFDGLMTEV